jgi:hypothetical protein
MNKEVGYKKTLASRSPDFKIQPKADIGKRPEKTVEIENFSGGYIVNNLEIIGSKRLVRPGQIQ